MPKPDERGGKMPRCQVLNGEGKQCRRRTLFTIQFHGDPELRGESLSWVKVYVCPEHVLGTVYAKNLLT